MEAAKMNYQEAVAYIESIPKFTSKTDLAHTARLLALLGNPQERIPHVIHVAGTNGKGSVCSFLNSCLLAGGYRCGLFTSPHLTRINERIQIDSTPVSDEAFLEAFRRVMEAADAAMAGGDAHPTYFETLFLMGILIFAGAGVEYCILETGMGGRLDQTNVIAAPDAAVITSVSMDHIEYLGSTIQEIAAEKAGIIKAGVPVIFDANQPAAADVIRARAEQLGSPRFAVSAEDCVCLRQDGTGITFRYAGREIHISSIADYQMMNAALAYKTLEVLSGVHGMAPETVLDGLSRASWPCRMECTEDGIVIDGAHNADGVAAFIRTAAHFHRTNELTILFSAVSDKDYPEMIREIAEEIRPEHVVTTRTGGSRGLPAEVFAEQFIRCGCADTTACDDVETAWKTALARKGAGMLFCVGSLYLAGELRVLRDKGK